LRRDAGRFDGRLAGIGTGAVKARTILISGMGVAGPTLAFWLKTAGFEPTLVEAAPALRRGGYVIDFWGLGYEIAARMGLESELHRVGYHMREMRIVDDQGRRVSGFGAGVFRELTGGRFVTLSRSELSRLLVERIEGAAEVIFGDEIVALRDGPKDVQATFKHGGERRFDLVVGADGLHSGVRRLVFGPENRFEKRLGYIVAAFETQGYGTREEDVYVIYGRAGRMLARVALRDDRTLFLFVFAADGDSASAGDLASQKAALRAIYGEGEWECRRILEELDRAQDLYFDRVSQIKMERWSRGRVALVGDAAFCASLLAGQGSALAMIAAYALAGELAKAEGRHEEAFAQYESLLRDFIAAKQIGAERFAGAFAPRTAWGLWVRNQVLKAFAIPGLARFAFGRDIVDTLRLPDYRWPALESANPHAALSCAASHGAGPPRTNPPPAPRPNPQ
jgi:2-polyprenyl-6-methoxyphenol hydroxylase-like FAD-dependent oxidoreductase